MKKIVLSPTIDDRRASMSMYMGLDIATYRPNASETIEIHTSRLSGRSSCAIRYVLDLSI